MKQKLCVCLLLALLLTMMVPVCAADAQTAYILDDAGLLTERERMKLNETAEELADTYGCGVYFAAVDSLRVFDESDDAYWAAVELYHGENLGIGAERNGILLLLSMEYRDYALFVYGDEAEYAFDDYGLEVLEDEFLDDFGSNSWYTGCDDYLRHCEEFLQLAAEGNPVRAGIGGTLLLSVGISMVVALIVCIINWMKMKTFKKTEAQAYVTEQGLDLTEERDVFIRRSVTRRKIETSSSSGGTSRSGGGGHGRSGKF